MACTELYTHYLLGDRSLDTFTAFVLTERALAEAMRRAADPQTARALREGVQRMNAPLRPDAATEVILKAVTLAREGSRTARK